MFSPICPHISSWLTTVGGTCARSIVIIAFTIISICGFVLETDRGPYEMILGCVHAHLIPVLIPASKSTSRRDTSTTHLVLPCVQLDHEFARANWLPIEESRFLARLGGRVYWCALSWRYPIPTGFSLLVCEETWELSAWPWWPWYALITFDQILEIQIDQWPWPTIAYQTSTLWYSCTVRLADSGLYSGFGRIEQCKLVNI